MCTPFSTDFDTGVHFVVSGDSPSFSHPHLRLFPGSPSPPVMAVWNLSPIRAVKLRGNCVGSPRPRPLYHSRLQLPSPTCIPNVVYFPGTRHPSPVFSLQFWNPKRCSTSFSMDILSNLLSLLHKLRPHRPSMILAAFLDRLHTHDLRGMTLDPRRLFFFSGLLGFFIFFLFPPLLFVVIINLLDHRCRCLESLRFPSFFFAFFTFSSAIAHRIGCLIFLRFHTAQLF